MPCTCPSLLTDLWASTWTFFSPFPTYQSDYLFKTTSLVFFKTSNDFQCSQQKPLSLTQLFVPGLLTLLPRLLSRSLSSSHPSLPSVCQLANILTFLRALAPAALSAWKAVPLTPSLSPSYLCYPSGLILSLIWTPTWIRPSWWVHPECTLPSLSEQFPSLRWSH